MQSLCILCVLAFPCFAYGLECYQCYHSTDDFSHNDDNCEEASKMYLRECTTPIDLSKGSQEYLTKEKNSVLSINNADKKENMEFSCIVIDVELYNGKDNLTVRGCVLKQDTGFDANSPSSFKTYIYICNTDGCNDPHTGFSLESICKYFSYAKTALATAGVMVGAAGLVAVTPIAIGAAGFTASGVAAGSLAATAQAGMGGTVVGGGIFATLQSIGAGGLALSSKALIGLIGGSAGGAMFLWFSDIYNSAMCN